MANERKMIVFGPVPSRRLGQSLGINNIPEREEAVVETEVAPAEEPTEEVEPLPPEEE